MQIFEKDNIAQPQKFASQNILTIWYKGTNEDIPQKEYKKYTTFPQAQYIAQHSTSTEDYGIFAIQEVTRNVTYQVVVMHFKGDESRFSVGVLRFRCKHSANLCSQYERDPMINHDQ